MAQLQGAWVSELDQEDLGRLRNGAALIRRLPAPASGSRRDQVERQADIDATLARAAAAGMP